MVFAERWNLRLLIWFFHGITVKILLLFGIGLPEWNVIRELLIFGVGIQRKLGNLLATQLPPLFDVFWITGINIEFTAFELFNLGKQIGISAHGWITQIAYSQKGTFGLLFPIWALGTTLERKGHFLAFVNIIGKYGVIIISQAFFSKPKFWNAPLGAARTKIYVPLVVLSW